MKATKSLHIVGGEDTVRSFGQKAADLLFKGRCHGAFRCCAPASPAQVLGLAALKGASGKDRGVAAKKRRHPTRRLSMHRSRCWTNRLTTIEFCCGEYNCSDTIVAFLLSSKLH